MFEKYNIIFSGFLVCSSLCAIDLQMLSAPQPIIDDEYCEEVKVVDQDIESSESSIPVISEPDHLPRLNPGYRHVGSCLNPSVGSRAVLSYSSFNNVISATLLIQRNSGKKPEGLLRAVLMRAAWKVSSARESSESSIPVIAKPDHLSRLKPGSYHAGSCLNPSVESRAVLSCNSFNNVIAALLSIQRNSGKKPEDLLRAVLLRAAWKGFINRSSLDIPFRCRIFDDFLKL